MLSITFLGILLTSVIVALHTAGTVVWIRFALKHQRKSGLRKFEFSIPEMCRVIAATAVVLILLHLVEVLIWATAYYMIPSIATPATPEDCIYFSMVTFTSLGFGDIVISGPWRLLSGIQGMAGMLVFGWSSAVLFATLTNVAGFVKPQAVVHQDSP